jgi:hypothetical protein
MHNHSKHNCISLKDGVNDPGLAFTGKVGLGPFWTWVQVLSYVHALQLFVGVGEFRKTRHPRNVKSNKVLKACFSGAGDLRFSEAWNLRSYEFANVRDSGILVR